MYIHVLQIIIWTTMEIMMSLILLCTTAPLNSFFALFLFVSMDSLKKCKYKTKHKPGTPAILHYAEDKL